MVPFYAAALIYNLGYKYAGVQYGKECWCGDTYGKYGEADKELCTTYSCPAESTKKCGGHLAQMIYQTGYGGT